jgi:DNA helicase-2/ATP-dependent DNA helicase PcrA
VPPPRDPEEPVPPPLARFLEQIALLGEADAATPEGRVALMTLHAAKGLEFTAVFLTGMEEGTFPREPWRDLSAGEIAAEYDEERRLCYVGMTRAKRRLTLSLARRRMGFSEGGPSFRSTEPSRFLHDLPPELFGEAVAREVRAREARAAPGPPPQARGPVVRRMPGALPGEPHVELDGDGAPAPVPAPRLAGAAARARGGGGEPVVDYAFDQRPEAAGTLPRGARVAHAAFGEGVVLSCEGAGREAKAWVRFDSIGDKLVLVRFLRAG